MKTSLFLLMALISFTLHPMEDNYSLRLKNLAKALRGRVGIISSETDKGRLNKNFYYLTGISDKGKILMILPDRAIVFGKFSKSRILSLEIESSEKFDSILRRESRKRDITISFKDLELLKRCLHAIGGKKDLKNIDLIVAGMRVIKDKQEISYLEKACELTAQSLKDVYRIIRPGLTEKHLKGVIEFGFNRRNADRTAFLQAASGSNSTFVHFGASERVLKKGDFLVFDVGAYYKNYTSDISRSVPVDGKFTKPQKEIYQLVLKAQKAAIKEMLPGRNIEEVHKIAEDILINGLLKLGFVFDKNSRWQRRFFIQHGFNHFIGLDVHDIWYDYKRNRKEWGETYRSGMVMTMEPGLYFPPDMLEGIPRRIEGKVSEKEFRAFVEKIRPVYRRYLNIGVRIEDDILITDSGNRILTSSVPKELVEIEKMMKQKSPISRLKFGTPEPVIR